MQNKWWKTGVAYNKLDSIDGTPNKWFQRWISHPFFDKYWQNMTPYKKDFAQIKIPVLAFDGYYNDGQSSGLYYLRELQKYSPETPAYLIIGPYGHFGTQRGGEPILYDYKVDTVALFNITKITYQWFDYILKNGSKCVAQGKVITKDFIENNKHKFSIVKKNKPPNMEESGVVCQCW